MKALDQPFTKIINGTTQFAIPVFQRDYSWTETQCEQLWQDVLGVAGDTTGRRHFLGSIVYVSTGDTSAGFTRWLLIDGQQRVTSLTLLLAALRDHIAETGWQGDVNGPTSNRIDAYFLNNVQEDGARRHKLVLRRHDQATLAAILDRVEMPEQSSERVRENYEFFRDRIVSVDPAVVYEGIGRLVVVDVTLDRGADDPQLVFESLNSTGVALGQSDLIRNYLLMRLPEREQTRMYEVYWSKVEQLFKGSERTFDSFARDFIALKTHASKQGRADQIYFDFRRQVAPEVREGQSLELLLNDMLRSARSYAAFAIGTAVQEELRDAFARLRHQVDVPAILIMRLFECWDAGTLAVDEFVAAVELIQSYIMRRAVCGEETRGYWRLFADFAYRLDGERPVASLQAMFARETGNYRFPADEEFRKALEDRDLYSKRVCFDVLERLENHGTNELSNTAAYSIEHVMPQNKNLSQEWRAMLGQNWEDVQREWLHRLGNLTLTGYNSTYSDRPFEEKKTIKDGFDQSAVRLNEFIRKQPRWSAAEMRERGAALAAKAITVWPPLVVDRDEVEADERREMLERAKRRDPAKVPMSQAARALFDQLSIALRGLDSRIIEVAEAKSVSYHGPAFFVEVIPRKNRLTLIFDLEFNEVEDSSGLAADSADYQFFVNATHEGGTYIALRDASEIPGAVAVARQAWDRSRR